MKKNRYGVALDRYGYAPSLLQANQYHCWMCGMNDQHLDRHEVFYGPYRKKSKELGLWVSLCHDRCHLNGVHKHGKKEQHLKQIAQIVAMLHYDWDVDQFIKEFGKNYTDKEIEDAE